MKCEIVSNNRDVFYLKWKTKCRSASCEMSRRYYHNRWPYLDEISARDRREPKEALSVELNQAVDDNDYDIEA